MAEGQTEPTVGELLSTLARDTGALMRQELQLAATEMTLKARQFGRYAGMIALGGALGLAGVLALLTAAIAALATLMPAWLAALIVGAVIAGAGYLLVALGMKALKRIDLVPEATAHSLKTDVTWAKEQVR